jgi:imidazolonepropionase
LNLFLRDITQLVTVSAKGGLAKTGAAMNDPGIIPDAGVLVCDGKIAWIGPMAEWSGEIPDDMETRDARGKVVIPGFVDSHTHALFAGSREHEFEMRAAGATYQQIADQGGGILSTIKNVRSADKRQLKKQTLKHLLGMLRHGTTTVEIKSGYGLDFESEIRMLEAINELKQEELISITPTFLGAHAVPPEFHGRADEYVREVTDNLIPYVGRRKLASYCDVFCEKGYFDLEQTARVLEAAERAGMKLKVHADELTPLGGAELAGRMKAVSADHLEHVTSEGIAALRDGGVVATVLPGVSFFLNHRYAPARQMIDAGVIVAIASDFNPGSCMSYSMPMMMTIAVTHMGMTPAEALTACTLNAAAALECSSTVGSIEVGKQADLLLAEVPDYRHLSYHFGMNHISATIKNGTLLEL